ncbi:MAG: glycosyltransferase [Acidobacteriota bacterium]|jgi:glycosyltransferase involved in cell wall biosynthesis
MVSGTPPPISIVIPALDEEGCIAAALAGLAGHRAPVEVLLVDGGSRDRTLALAVAAGPRAAARGLSLRVLTAPRGRARQMNAGAAAARAPILLFLHADTRLPADAVDAVRDALRDPGVVGGGFRHAFREGGSGCGSSPRGPTCVRA